MIRQQFDRLTNTPGSKIEAREAWDRFWIFVVLFCYFANFAVFLVVHFHLLLLFFLARFLLFITTNHDLPDSNQAV